MNDRLKKIIAVLLAVCLVFGWYAFINGVSGSKPLKDRIPLGLDIKGGVYVVMEAKTDLKGEELTELMNQTKEVIGNRVDQMGIANADVRVEGKNRIRVELPGAKDSEEAISQIGKTAQLKFTMADGSFVLDGKDVKNATIGQSEKGGYAVELEFKSSGATAFEKATKKAISGTITPTIKGEGGQLVDAKAIVIWLDDKVISSPVAQGVISGGKCEITGSFTQNQAKQLAALIRGGALPAPLVEMESSSQSAKIGIDAFNDSVKAGFVGVMIVLALMFALYRLMGLVADFALLIYILILFAVMGLAGNVLTLPGIAGIVLSIGMAVDANVVIFSRIKEEIVGGKTPRAAVKAGFSRAVTTVVDSQVTTLIAAVILYQIGTSAVKGFAWTLMIGILASLLTAVVVTQLLLGLLASSKKFGKNAFFGINKEGKDTFGINKNFSFLKHRKKYYIATLIVILLGLGTLGFRGFNLGIDFTGGTMLQVNMGHKVSEAKVEKVIDKFNLNEEIIFAGSKHETVVIKTAKALKNVEREEVLEALNKEFDFNKDDVTQGYFGPTIGKELTQNALKAILLATLGMLIYIRFRFKEWRFGVAAIAGIVHDILWVITFYAIFRVQVNNPFIAALLTVVGYSINDTIVIFDRIRENMRFRKRSQSEEVIDMSINQTLGRSILTSLTTLIVMVPLLVMASSSMAEFILPLMVGVSVGCLSSIFMCSPIYYDLMKMKGGSKYEKMIAEAAKQKQRESKAEGTADAKHSHHGEKKKSRAKRKGGKK